MGKMDISNIRKGHLVALYIAEKGSKGNRWLCQCDCGNTKLIYTAEFNRGCQTSCGCKGAVQIIIGQKYGEWTPLEEKSICGKKKCLCECSCGRKFFVFSSDLRNGTSSKCKNHWRKEYGVAARNRVVKYYKQNAKYNNRDFNLTDSELNVLFNDPCFYCGIKYFSCQNGKFDYNGIDRVDNNQGYNFDNVVTCCAPCNKAKGAMPQKDFVEWLDRVVEFRK